MKKIIKEELDSYYHYKRHYYDAYYTNSIRYYKDDFDYEDDNEPPDYESSEKSTSGNHEITNFCIYNHHYMYQVKYRILDRKYTAYLYLTDTEDIRVEEIKIFEKNDMVLNIADINIPIADIFDFENKKILPSSEQKFHKYINKLSKLKVFQ